MMKLRIILTPASLLAIGVAWAGYDGLPQVDQTHTNDQRDGKDGDYYGPYMIDLRRLNDPPYDDPRPATMLERFGPWKDPYTKQVRTVRIGPPAVPPARQADRIPLPVPRGSLKADRTLPPVPRGSLKADRIPLPVPRRSLKADRTLPPKPVPPGWTFTSILSWLEQHEKQNKK